MPCEENVTGICKWYHSKIERPKSLESVTVEMNKFFRICRDYEMGMSEWLQGKSGGCSKSLYVAQESVLITEYFVAYNVLTPICSYYVCVQSVLC